MSVKMLRVRKRESPCWCQISVTVHPFCLWFSERQHQKKLVTSARPAALDASRCLCPFRSQSVTPQCSQQSSQVSSLLPGWLNETWSHTSGAMTLTAAASHWDSFEQSWNAGYGWLEVCVWGGGGERLVIFWTSQSKHVHSWPDDAMRCLPRPCEGNMQSHDLKTCPSATESSRCTIRFIETGQACACCSQCFTSVKLSGRLWKIFLS